ncbi:BirA family biotin operon repressor/biotin-[acetyl-CoA-carboxylase] ligase [Marmoricola sp. OAE513]|uniref:biotin--[acetyl-CoA-carboxylase] ligase n=1 Tax=Marmoricola sp. OAE513 TaxID=2817894 RepID=UPI001AE789C1
MPTPDATWTPLELDALVDAAGPSWSVYLHPTATSTNALAAENPVPGTIVVADHQTAGRGRLTRSWDTPPGTALTFSAVVDPGLADHDWPLLPLGVALAVADGVTGASGVRLDLKWPNDLLVPDPDGEQRKLAGILLERVTGAEGRPLAVIGIGINVGLQEAELPVPTATSLAIAGSSVDRTEVFGAVALALRLMLGSLRREPLAILERYRTECDTIGREVSVELPDGGSFTGTATGLDRNGRLLVGDQAISAGDVLHVRPT